ncbi:MAG: hypothetical protein JSV00_09710 [bacterium]|nr:MAG: hypothetical protein JSV00_09710 [bacterium]
MNTGFWKIVSHLIVNAAFPERIESQFRPGGRSLLEVARNVNAAFLLGPAGLPSSHRALEYLVGTRGDRNWGPAARACLEALEAMDREVEEATAGDAWMRKAVEDLAGHLASGPGTGEVQTLERFHRLFFPEGVGLRDDSGSARERAVRQLREKRLVSVSRLNPKPVASPHREVLFTSNVLLTLPLKGGEEGPSAPPSLKGKILSMVRDAQKHWYDHPIPLGIERERNEAVYGLRGLNEAVRFESERGNAPAGSRVRVVLSVSTTHDRLRGVARDYLAGELAGDGSLDCLEVYAVTEEDTVRLLEAVFRPAAARWFPGRDFGALSEVLGVDGEYGRHYSFLKAVAALWQVLVDPGVRATFKFDLDQVFDQEKLVGETGRSAFEHLQDPLWGAEGTDSDGRPVELGMLAGALVNQGDIQRGLFTPDVAWPEAVEPVPEQWVFDSVLPQALSTEAEMMARYTGHVPDGRKTCLQRVHVTGGTTGILVDALRRHRPFTPTWIGRAEDQSYLMSVLFPDTGRCLRYFHASGLFMRHDKEGFAREAMEAARVGKAVGDMVRILAFTSYARALPWDLPLVKSVLDPFTGCFITRLPVTAAWLRLALKAGHLFGRGTQEADAEAMELVRTGPRRLKAAGEELLDPQRLGARLRREREGWDLFYDILDELETGMASGEPAALELAERTRRLSRAWKIPVQG